MFPRPSFFPGCTLNFAENLLFPPSDPDPESVAVISANERAREPLTWSALRERVRRCAAAMRHHGLKEGERVAGYLGNHANTVIAMLAATSVGALWTGVSPDTGAHAVLDRLTQIKPVLLFADNAVVYNEKVHQTHSKLSEVVPSLPTLKHLVIFSSVPWQDFDLYAVPLPSSCRAMGYDDFISEVREDEPLTFAHLSPDQPIYILYSSGTTGAPKPIVHSSLGTLLQHKKEHILHCDIGPGEIVCYFTTW